MTNQIEKATPSEVAIETIAQEKQIVKSDADIDGFIELRQKFIAKVNTICVEGKDYHVIQNKKSLAKGGAEKIASIFKWTAKFEKDTESLEMLGEVKGLVAYKCTLMNGQFVGEGRGAAMLARNNGDPNKTLKMAQKSAFIDAVLRASGLSDFFTQDLEDMPREQISEKPTFKAPVKEIGVKPANTAKPASVAQLNTIKKTMQTKGYKEIDLIDLGFGTLDKLTMGTASELIKFLFSAKSKEIINA